MADSVLTYAGLAHFKQKLDEENESAAHIVAAGAGFRALSDGTIEQWGVAKIANGSTGTRVVFPVAFPTAIESVVCTSRTGVPISYAATPDGLGAATIRHNGDGGVETYYHAVGK
jgi:hypothetical protein